MEMDTMIKRATILTVAVVAGIAAWISYTHIYSVGGHNPLLPISVDGMIVTSSLVLLAAHRAKLARTLWLARFTLWIGIGATLAANVAYGLPQGVLGATVSAWPAVCFVFTVETVMQLAKAQRIKRPVSTPPLGKIDLRTGASVLANKEPAKPRVTTPKPAKRKVPSILTIRAELHCGQPIATQVKQIMASGKTDSIQEAYRIRNEVK